MVLVLVVVVVLVLGGIGVLVAQSVKSETTPKLTGVGANPGSSASSGGAGRSARSGHLLGNASSAVNSTNRGSTKKTKATTSVKLAGGAAIQPVPSGWTSKAGSDGTYVVLSKSGFWVYVEIVKSDADAAAQVDGMLTAWVVNDDHYTQVLVTDPNPLDVSDPFTSAANLAYNGLYTSNGGSASVYGVLIAFDRSDGLVLRMQVEAFSATDTADAQAKWTAQKADITKIFGVIDSFASTA